MAKIISRLPFNGTNQGSGSIPVTAALKAAEYSAGRLADPALNFPSVGRAEVLRKIFPFDATFTFTAWVKVAPQAGGPSSTWLLYKFPGYERYIYIDLGSTLTRWSFIGIVQDVDRVSVYLNAKRIKTENFPAEWSKPTGFALVNDSPATSGFLTIEDVTLYEGADYTLVKPAIPTPTTPMDIKYSINGVDFKTYGVYVSNSDGILDNLAIKDPIKMEWPDYHGEVIDLSAVRYQPRTIQLSCFIKTDGVDDFIEKVNAFLAQFQKPGTQRLKLNAYTVKPHVYEVYLANSIGIKKRWSDTKMVGTFELSLVEPEPVKRVLSFGTGLVSVTLSSNKVLAFHWGDGNHTYDVFGQDQTITHDFTTPGPHEIIISGVIEDITEFTSTATVLWNKLL